MENMINLIRDQIPVINFEDQIKWKLYPSEKYIVKSMYDSMCIQSMNQELDNEVCNFIWSWVLRAQFTR